MTVRYSYSCPVDHSQDADIVLNVLNDTGVGGDGGTAAVIVRDGVNVGIIYIR